MNQPRASWAATLASPLEMARSRGAGGGGKCNKVLLGGDFTSVDNLSRTAAARLLSDSPAVVVVTAAAGGFTFTRTGGTAR